MSCLLKPRPNGRFAQYPSGVSGQDMKRTQLKRKTRLRAKTQINRRAKLSVVGHSETSELKREIQALCRDIVILRDGGCFFRRYPGHICSGYAQDGHLILQADHM